MALIIHTDLQGGIFASGNPITLKLTNHDGFFDGVDEASVEWGEPYSGKCVLTNGDPAGGSFETLLHIGMLIQINGSNLNGEYEIIGVLSQFDVIVIDLIYNPSYANDQGAIIINSDPPALYVETEIYHGNTYLATIYNSRLSDYIVKIDFSSFIRNLFNRDNMSRYLYINFLDTNLCSYFKYRYREHRVGTDFDPMNEFTSFSPDIYVIYSAMQLGDHGGGDLDDYSIKVIPQDVITDDHKYRKFLTKFERPKFFKGYPFDISFLWWENVLQPEVVVKVYRKDYLGDLTYTLLEDNLINNLGYGLQRCWMKEPADSRTKTIEFALRALDNNSWFLCINPINIEYDDECYTNGVYLCWLNTLGGFDYWLFHTAYAENINVDDPIVAKRFITDWENQGTQKDIVSKNAQKSLVIGADNLRVDQLIGLRDLLYSKRVMMLMNADEFTDDRFGAIELNPWSYTSCGQSFGSMTALLNQDTSPVGYTVGQFIRVNGNEINGVFEILIITDPGIYPAGIVIRLQWDASYATDAGNTFSVSFNVDPIWQTVIVKDGSWNLYDAKFERASLELEIEFPDINIQ